MAIKWRYHVATIDNDYNAVNEHMAEWAKAGWELVNGTAVSFINGPVMIRYILYWRKLINPDL